MYTRKNQRDLTRSERRRFVDAVLELKSSGRYDEFVQLHREFYVTDGEDRPRAAHMTPSFFPWHRRYLLEFEKALREVDGSVTVPYWDWTRDRAPDGPLWADDFMGGNGRSGDRQVTSGPFAHESGRWTLGSTSGVPFLTRNLGRPADPVGLPTQKELDGALKDGVYDADPWNSLATKGFRNRIEGWGIRSAGRPVALHNQVHRWVGGAMAGAASPDDPVFWLHHAFLDLVWGRWQKAHPRSGYQPAAALPRDHPEAGRVFALRERMPPWDVAPSALLAHDGVYRYA
ncbi:tyrosinase family protein [uncultured Streptomyces sp.]|uniref:tyrosinase family protein n=1 Tax=uncultured Streptomyces sp. TaxID=174707 RepID=UPI00262524EA|nr:tyrosinase family protein [uncultured Streptomyces sp.]